jgi:phosphatidylserine decarboxylase
VLHARTLGRRAGHTLRRALLSVALQEDVNFLVANRIPRRYATLFMGWFSRLEVPWVRGPSLALLRLFAGDLRLDEAKQKRFGSLHELFIRELRDGARPIDPDPRVVVSPCDAVVGTFGRLRGLAAIQAKGLSYPVEELLGGEAQAARLRDGVFVTCG